MLLGIVWPVWATHPPVQHAAQQAAWRALVEHLCATCAEGMVCLFIQSRVDELSGPLITDKVS